MIHTVIDIWKDETYHSDLNDGFRPTLSTYVLGGEKKRPAVLVCPGGGYRYCASREGEAVAIQFNAAGFHAFVLNYSVAPRKHPQPLLDVSRSMCIIRENADLWNIDKNKIAVCGFSAGGHLAASLGVHWDKPYLKGVPGIREGMNRPDALILCYPVITAGKCAHINSFKNLLGEDAGSDLLEEMSLEKHVYAGTPPSFIWHTFEDATVPVENSLLFAQSLRENNIPFDLHIYQKGTHGLSLATQETAVQDKQIEPHASSWMKLCCEWLWDLFEVSTAS